MRTTPLRNACANFWLKLSFLLLLMVLPSRGQTQADSVVVRADTLVLHDGASAVGQACGKVVLRDPSVGQVVCRDTNARSLMVPQASTSQNAVTVGYGQRVVLDTGSHGDVLVRSGATLVLPKGHFRMSSLALEWDAHLVLDSASLGDSGTVSLDVTNSVHLMDRVTVGIGAVRSGGALRSAQALTVVAGNLQLDNDLYVGGQFYAVNAITLGDRVSLTGVLSAIKIAVGYDTKLIYAASLAHGEVVADDVRMVSPQDNSWTNATSLAVKWTVNGIAHNDVESLPIEGPKVIRRCSGNVCVQITVNVDRTAPVVKILSPADEWITNKASTELVWSVDSIQQKETITLPEGSSTLTRSARDSAGNTGSATIHVSLDTHIPVVKILSPVDGFLTNAASQTLRYSVDGVEQPSVTVPLVEGTNVLTRRFTSKAGNTGTASIVVRLDTKPPVIAFVSPKDGDTLRQDRVAVSWTVDGVLRQDSASLAEGVNQIRRVGKDSAGNQSEATISVIYSKPVVVLPGMLKAPPIPKVPSPPFSWQVGFLWQGDSAIQKGVLPGSLDTLRVSVLRGVVQDESGKPVAGAKITLLGHPEWGYTLSRTDGWFDLGANYGQSVVVDVQKDGFCPSQRRVIPMAGEYVHVEEIRLVPFDAKVTSVDFSGGSTVQQVIVGTPQTDVDGTRTAVVVTPAGTKAWLELPNGTTVPVSSLSVRATEYTVGEKGVARMPGDLPQGVAYTYAVELSADEAVAAGAQHVRFDRPLSLYVENFPGFPVGNAVPLGWYDRTRGVWVAANSGHVLRILGVQSGKALLDIDGSFQAAGNDSLVALGITSEELVEIAGRYPVGSSFWRVQIEHFSAWDCNWGIFPPEDAVIPTPVVETKQQDDECTEECGSIVGVQDRRLGESIDLPGMENSLIYSSIRADGHISNHRIVVRVSGDSVANSLKRIELSINVSGQYRTKEFAPSPNQTDTFFGMEKMGMGELSQTPMPKSQLEMFTKLHTSQCQNLVTMGMVRKLKAIVVRKSLVLQIN